MIFICPKRLDVIELILLTTFFITSKMTWLEMFLNIVIGEQCYELGLQINNIVIFLVCFYRVCSVHTSLRNVYSDTLLLHYFVFNSSAMLMNVCKMHSFHFSRVFNFFQHLHLQCIIKICSRILHKLSKLKGAVFTYRFYVNTICFRSNKYICHFKQD